MPIGAIAGIAMAGASVYSANKTAKASKQAAAVQAAAADQATALQRDMFEQTRGDLEPYRGVGEGAIYSLADLYGLATPDNPQGGQAFGEEAIAAFERSPDYAFALDQGLKALDKSAAARGQLISGGQLRELTNYGQGLASQNFNNYASRLMSLANLGENASARTGALGVQTGQSMANTILGSGEAQASGIIGSANAQTQGLQQAGNNLLFGLNAYQNQGNPFGSSAYQLPSRQPGYVYPWSST